MKKWIFVLFMTNATLLYADRITEATLRTGGAKVVWDDGATAVFTATSDTAVEQVYTYADGYKSTTSLFYGAFPIESDSSRSGIFTRKNLIEFKYAIALSDMPKPVANAWWQTDAALYFWDGGQTAEIISDKRMNFSWGEVETITLGRCRYDMIPGKFTTTDGNGAVFNRVEYLIGAGIAVSVGQWESWQDEPNRLNWTIMSNDP